MTYRKPGESARDLADRIYACDSHSETECTEAIATAIEDAERNMRDHGLYAESLRDDLKTAAKLIAQVEWGAVDYHGCPWCGREVPHRHNGRTLEGVEAGPGTHADDCPLPGLLRHIATT